MSEKRPALYFKDRFQEITRGMDPKERHSAYCYAVGALTTSLPSIEEADLCLSAIRDCLREAKAERKAQNG